MFENDFLNAALSKATQRNTVDVVMIFSLINGYLNGSISEKDFLNDIKVLTASDGNHK
jgi:hypothetical protein